MIAWGDSVEGAGLMSVKKQQHLTRTSTMTPQLGALTILTLWTHESALRLGRQTETLQVELSVAVAFTDH